MKTCVFSVLLVVLVHLTFAQLPPRPLHIPGALLVQGGRPAPLRQGRLNAADFGPPRPRRPPSAPSREIRPVVEEAEESPQGLSAFDAEVNKLGITALNSAVRQAVSEGEEEEEPTLRPSPLPFRPEKPIPVTRDQIREAAPRPLPPPQQRQEARPVLQQFRQPPRPQVRQEIDEEENVPVVRQPVRQKARVQQPAPQQFRQPSAPVRPRPVEDDEANRKRKPVSQILSKFRTDNPDGSITWGFENDDGTFKEETLGIDCITRGKYGYFDPDGVRRDFTYETGNKCENGREALQEDDEEEEELLARPQPKRPANFGLQKPQFRPQ